MGCIGSRLTDVVRRSNRGTQNLFSVLNVDEMGRHISPGKLEVTETDLVLHIRGKAPLTWPLRCLRRYGYEEDLFSFESGRRCPTGAGIYAFKCGHAQALFNLLQARIQGNSVVLLPNSTSPLSLSTNPPLSDYVNITEDRGDPGGSGPRTQPLYINVENDRQSPLKPHRVSNGMNGRRVQESVYQNCGGLPERNYGNVEHNIGSAHCVEVNYAELDLEIERDLAERTEEKSHLLPRQSTLSDQETPPSTLDLPNGELGYATIDFDRTAALSVVATRSKMKLDINGDDTTTRRTRHNSTAL